MILSSALAFVLAAAPAAAAPKSKPAPKAPSSRTSGRIIKTDAEKGTANGRITVADDAGHIEQFRLDRRTRATCDGKKSAWLKAAVPDACDHAAKIVYNPATKRVSILELKTAAKKDADDSKTRPNVSGEIALTDVLAGTLSVRLGGGSTVDFKVGDATKIVAETEGQPPTPVAFESLKVGDRVEVHSKDWKTADEIHVRSAPR
ncbi:MAG: hypothetical protein KGL74_13105 [Elusimicrobia bacterium]|nr:hypothetical protein [Elusimicrobiota bacterium]